jgi:hypothetical protein
VFVRTESGWAYEARLTPSDQQAYDHLGYHVSVSADGSTVLVTAVTSVPAGDERTPPPGKGYIFIAPAGGWTGAGEVSQAAELKSTDAHGYDVFGSGAGISGDGSTVAIGARYHNERTGEAYVFSEPSGGWTGSITQTTILRPRQPIIGEQLGDSVALSENGETILVGADDEPRQNTSERSAGSAYVYSVPRGGWASQTELEDPTELQGPGENGERGVGEQFGTAVALTADGETAVVAAGLGGPAKDGGLGAGRVYVFEHGSEQWQRVATLAEPEEGEHEDDYFGYALAVAPDGSFVAAGAPNHFEYGDEAGAVFTFERSANDEWILTNELVPPEAAAPLTNEDQEFGETVTLAPQPNDQHDILVGAPWAATSSTASMTKPLASAAIGTAGAKAYLFTLGGQPLSPTIASFAPPEAHVGSTVVISGSNVSDASRVAFATTPANIISDSSKDIDVTVPVGALSGTITVTTPGGTGESSKSFLVLRAPAPQITKLTPKKGASAGGQLTTIRGTNLDAATEVAFGSAPAPHFVIDSPTEITATTPASTTGSVDVRVTIPEQTSPITSADKYLYSGATVTSVAPASGPTGGGGTVTIGGSGFALGTATKFLFGKVAGTAVSCASSTSCTVTVPASGKNETVTVLSVVVTSKAKKSASAHYTYG